MFKQSQTRTSIQLALAAVCTPLVAVATMVLTIYVPQTKGFFNVGETVVFTVALLLGPLVGAFAGGVGSMLADILLGCWYYAPATLVVKACEGGVVGVLARMTPKLSKTSWRYFTLCLGLVSGVLLGGIGSLYYSGEVELYLGIPPPESPNLIFSVSELFWYFLGALVVFLVTLTGFVVEPEFGWQIFSVFIGGAIMVVGYFLYQLFLLFPLFGIEAVAFAELPVNVGQMIIGLVISVSIVRIIRRSLPQISI